MKADIACASRASDDAAGLRARCPYCGGAANDPLEASERMLGLGGRFAYPTCGDCGALWLASIPDDLERYYPEDYYASKPFPERVRGGPGWAMARSLSRLRLHDGRLARALSGRRFGRFDWLRRTRTGLDDPILDVGCGNGRLLRRLAARGFGELVGIDPHWPERSAPNASLRFERETPETHAGRYRLVMAHHSFEHMPDPARAFRAMARLVLTGGHLLLRVPRADGWARAHYGADWVQLDAPRHLHVPTRRSIERLAESAGLRVVDVVDDSGPFQIWGSEVYRRGFTLAEAGRSGRRVLGPVDRLRARIVARRLRRAGRGDQACFYLEKPPAAASDRR